MVFGKVHRMENALAIHSDGAIRKVRKRDNPSESNSVQSNPTEYLKASHQKANPSDSPMVSQ